MTTRPTLSARRAVEIYEVMIQCRREYCADTEFFKMPDVLEYLCGGDGGWSINTYRSDETEDFRRKAGVVSFGDRITLTVDEKLMENARRGCKLPNFILAHEVGHIELEHNTRSTKHFQLFPGPQGMANVPPTQEELEANYAAVFFQCGVALADPRWKPLDLARRAFSDDYYVKKAQAIVRLDVFQRELNRPRPKRERVIL